MEQNFFLNKINYEKHFKDLFVQSERHYEYVIQYLVVLPFDIAFAEDGVVTIHDQDKSYSFIFSRQLNTEEYTAGQRSERYSIEYYRTVVEMCLFTNEDYNLDGQTQTEVFEVLLANLNHIIKSYLIKTKQSDIYTVSSKMLEPLSIYRKVKLSYFEMKDAGIFNLHTNMKFAKDTLAIELQKDVLHFIQVVKNQENPFVLSEEYIIYAWRNLQEGFYDDSVIKAQIALESFLRNLHRQMLIIEGTLTEKKVLPFITMVKNEFVHRIGGTWNLKDINNEVGAWYQKCYELRNRIVHAGYHANEEESFDAINAVESFRLFVFKQLKKSKNFSRLTKLL